MSKAREYEVVAEVFIRYRWSVQAENDTDATEAAEANFVFPWQAAARERIVEESRLVEVVRRSDEQGRLL